MIMCFLMYENEMMHLKGFIPNKMYWLIDWMFICAYNRIWRMQNAKCTFFFLTAIHFAFHKQFRWAWPPVRIISSNVSILKTVFPGSKCVISTPTVQMDQMKSSVVITVLYIYPYSRYIRLYFPSLITPLSCSNMKTIKLESYKTACK